MQMLNLQKNLQRASVNNVIKDKKPEEALTRLETDVIEKLNSLKHSPEQFNVKKAANQNIKEMNFDVTGIIPTTIMASFVKKYKGSQVKAINGQQVLLVPRTYADDISEDDSESETEDENGTPTRSRKMNRDRALKEIGIYSLFFVAVAVIYCVQYYIVW